MVIRRGSRLINTTSRREAFPSRKEMNEEGSVEERRQRADTVGCDVSHLSKALESREFQPSKLVFVFFFFFFRVCKLGQRGVHGLHARCVFI